MVQARTIPPTPAGSPRASRLLLAALVALAPACGSAPTLGEVPAAQVDALAVEQLERSPARVGPIVLAHGGQGSPASRSDGPAAAVAQGFAALEPDDDALAAAIATIVALEDDPRFNAGIGANLRVDGRSIEADAAIMTDDARFGAVAGIDGVRHPIYAAAAVRDSPHLLLVADGAQRFAVTLGLETAALETVEALAKLRRAYPRLFDGAGEPWARFDWRRHWNFPTPAPASLDEAIAALDARERELNTAARERELNTAARERELNTAARERELAVGPRSDRPAPDETQDTVGVVVRTASGRYAAALSTGGTTLALHGRVGDVPVLGAGLYAGPHGAVAATGKGEAIMRERVAAEVYALLAAGRTPNDAIRLATREISEAEGVGVIAVSALGWGTGATSQMAWAVRERQAAHRADTWVQHDGR